MPPQMANFKEAENHHRLQKRDVTNKSASPTLVELYFATFGKSEIRIYKKNKDFKMLNE